MSTTKISRIQQHLTYWVLLLILCTAKSHADPQLNGVAIHGELGQEQFIAGLFVSTLTRSSDSILASQEEKRLQVRVLAPQLSSRRFRRMWIEGIAINSSPGELEKHAENLADFSNMVKIKMVAGDIFTVDRTSNYVRVSVNGTALGDIEDTEFFDLMLRTWIGQVPLSSNFRSNLLIEGAIAPGPLARFEGTRPNDARIATIEQAVIARAATVQATKPAQNDANPVVLSPAIDLPSANDSKPKLDIEVPKLELVVTPLPTQTPLPTPVIALAPKEEELDDSIFEEEGESEFTAESLLKEQLYYSQLAKYTNRFLKYPQRAWDKGREGYIRLRVTIDRSGKVKDTELLEQARFQSLNKEARKAVNRASPYPAVPEEIDGEEYSFTFRIAFKIVSR